MDDLDNYIDWQSGRTGYFATVAYLIRGVTHFYRGEYILGVSDITMAYGFQPQFVLNYATYGAGYRITAQREYQIYDLQQQIKQNPKQADLYLQLANLDMEYGHWQEGIDNYRAYKDLMPNHELDYLVDALEVVLLNP